MEQKEKDVHHELNLLILEDEPHDAELVINTLEEAGYICRWDRVETREEFTACLDTGEYDLILSDYNLPHFDGISALNQSMEHNIDVPFIIISGAIGEEIAIESLKAGATYYVLKDHLSRLAPVVKRALQEKEERHRRSASDEALRKERDFTHTLVNTTPAFFVAIGPDGKTIMMNASMLHALGYTLEEVSGADYLSTFVPAGEHGGLIDIYRQLTVLKQPTFNENTVLTKDGRELCVEWYGRPVLRGDNLEYFFGVGIDITERKRAKKEKDALQEQLRQSQKMEAIGQLAGGIAHDFNNLLTVIQGYSEIALLKLEQENPLRDAMLNINNAALKAGNLTRQLLAFGRRQVLEIKVIDLNETIRDLNNMLRRILGEDIELTIALEKNLGFVKVDPRQIDQVIINLAVNARDAMPTGGKLTIETANVDLGESYTRDHIGIFPGPHVMLSVSDTGVGISPEIKDHIFEPFFTTKERGKGTGLGLSTIYGIVNQCEGNICVYSEPGLGTTFKLYFPQISGTRDTLKKKTSSLQFPRGSETILVVEDNMAAKKLAVEILTMQGYRVLEASDGQEALNIAKTYVAVIDLVLTDVVMPQISGKELIDQLWLLPLGCKVLYMSGYTDDAIVHHGVLCKGLSYIQKPFTVESLSKKVREVLDTH